MLYRFLLLAFAAAVYPVTAVVAQDLQETRARNLSESRAAAQDSGKLKALTVQQQVKPAFIIQPLVHRLTARRGQLLTFEFEIEANARPTRLEISPVAMSQQEHGVIMPDTAAVPPNVIQLISQPAITLQVGQSHTIQCRMRIPPVNAPFLSYGVLVKELPPEPDSSESQPDEARVGIRFLTQYLLRTDIEVLGVQGDTVRDLQIESGHLAQRDGNAVILAYVNNPTDTSMEYEVRSELVSLETGRACNSRLWMPVRSTQPEPDRFRVRTLGKTRLRLEGGLPQSVFPGKYELHLKLTHQNRVYQKATFPVEIKAGDFPAQDATIVRVARDISIEPPHVELSLRKGGNRVQSITIENGSQQTIVAQLQPRSFIGNLADSVQLRPDTLQLLPGRRRKVLVMLGNNRDFTEHSYAFAEITVRPETGSAIGTQRIPIALLTNSDKTAKVEAGSLNWKVTPSAAGFEIPVTNIGARHLELQSKLSLRDQFGRGFVVETGYGRWILPGETDRLWFPFPQVPPPGIYAVNAEISQGADLPAVELNRNIQLRSELEERISGAPRELEKQ